MSTPYLPSVRNQYEALPYPERNPEDEKQRLNYTWLEFLAQINHYCFRGRRDFRRGFRALVAGGGTGDATLFLAEQLRGSDAEVVYLDISEASLDIARRRAQVRKLENIRWVHGSLLDTASFRLDRFDYISCTGVLHHLANPEAGLNALLEVLAPAGALNLMVYGRYGRSGVYEMQELMGRVIPAEGVIQDRVASARAVLMSVPRTNGWARSSLGRDPSAMNDAEIYDTFLHSQDRAYTVPELYDWMADRCGLHLRFFGLNVGSMSYLPESYVTEAALLARIASLPLREQHAIAELIAGNLALHSVIATREPEAAASPRDLENVPFFFGPFDTTTGMQLAAEMDAHPKRSLRFNSPESGIGGELLQGEYTRHVLRYLDGERSLGEIFAMARHDKLAGLAGASDESLLQVFAQIYNSFCGIEGMLLRHESVPRFPNYTELAQRSFQWQTPPNA